jgi:AraC-like DNA-binding protein
MSERLNELPDPPDPPVDQLAPPTDALSDVLDRVRLRGATVQRCAPEAPFSIAYPAGLRLLHFVESGALTLIVGDEKTQLHSGDVVLLPRALEHTLHSATDGPAARRPLQRDDLYNNESPPGHRPDHWLTGTFAVDDAAAEPVLNVLPPATLLRSTQRSQWLPLSIQLLVAEVSDPYPGAAVMVSRILDLMFIQTLRSWAREDTARTPGCLTAAVDPQIGLAIGVMHRNPAHPWSVTELARVATLSRSTFAERFTTLLGSPPAAYLTETRLRYAADILSSTDEPISKIARTVGYTSDAAFIRAFTRHYGKAPGRWRRAKTTSREPVTRRV